jgi:hypothetical protein
MKHTRILAASLLAVPSSLLAQAPTWSMDGSVNNSLNGFRAVVVGDYNGNGTDDVLIGEPGDLGANFVPAGGSAAIRDGNGSCITIFYGLATRRMGTGLARLPDINGDGRDEILIGSPGYGSSSSGVLNGRVELIYGGRDGGGAPGCAGAAAIAADLLIDRPNGPGAQLNGDEFGHAIEVLGDIDGDGRADFAVGAPNGHQTPVYGDNRGYVMVYSSAFQPNGPATLLYRIDGELLNSYFGAAICRIGDVNGDGVQDFAVGAPYASFGGQQFPGRVSCYSGATGKPFLRIDGANIQTLGTSLANLGDVDGDGSDELVLGIPGDRPAGAAIGMGSIAVVRGSYLKASATLGLAGAPVIVGIATLPTLYRLRGDSLYAAAGVPAALDAFGHALANVGDLDGDGSNDLLIGAPGATLWNPDGQSGGNWPGSAGLAGAGMARLVSGKNGICIKQYQSPTAQTGGTFGAALAGGGDFDGDGVGDFVIAAPYEDFAVNQVNRGRTRAWSGNTEFGVIYGNGLANSTGLPGRIRILGSQSVAANRFRVELSQLPASSSGIVLMSPVQVTPGVTVGNGLLFLGNPIDRVAVLTTNDVGVASAQIDLTLPLTTGVPQPLSRWNLQFWHRDVGGTVNLTDAITVGLY